MSAMSPGATSLQPKFLLLLGGVGVAVLANLETFQSMVTIWFSEGFQHCFLIPPISAAILWARREALDKATWTTSWLGLLTLVGSLWLWLVGKNIALLVAQHVAVILIVSSLVWTMVGTRIWKRLAFAFVFLFFAVPFGDGTVPVLIEITADLSAGALRLFGVPVLREGAYMTLPGGMFEIAESCSGFRYLNAGLAISVLVAVLSFKSWKRRLLFVAAFVAMCLLMNGFRAFVVMWVASVTQMRVFVGYDHVVFGWILFAAVMLGMIAMAGRYSDKHPDVPA